MAVTTKSIRFLPLQRYEIIGSNGADEIDADPMITRHRPRRDDRHASRALATGKRPIRLSP
jgi:hypothetical protein